MNTNIIETRRLAFIKGSQKRQAQAYLDGKKSVQEIAEANEVTPIQALYGIQQAAVEHGLVDRIELDANNRDAVTRAHGDGEYASWSWLACRAGVTPHRPQAPT